MIISRREFLKNGALWGLALSGYELPGWAATKNGARVLVIGAGVAGLAAARTLTDAGFSSVIVLEGRDRLGGRLWTDRSFSDGPIDLGASWIHGKKDQPIYQLAVAHKFSFKDTDNEARPETFTAAGLPFARKRRDQMDGTFALLREQAYAARDRLAAGADVSLGATFDELLGKRKLNAEEALDQRHLLTTEIENDYATDASTLSLRHWDRGRSFSGGDVVLPNGYDQILAPLIRGLTIRLGQTVEKVEYGGEGAKVTVDGGQTYLADHVVVTLPLGVLKKGTVGFFPELPAKKTRAIQRLGMGLFDKLYLKFPQRFWGADASWIECVGEDPRAWPMFLNVAKFTGRPVLAAFHVGEAAAEFEKRSNEENVAGAMTVLRKIYGAQIPSPTEVKVTRWGEDPFARGAYSYVPVGGDSGDLDVLGEPVGSRLYFAGEATSAKDYATVHAAYLSGVRAAEQIRKVAVTKKRKS